MSTTKIQADDPAYPSIESRYNRDRELEIYTDGNGLTARAKIAAQLYAGILGGSPRPDSPQSCAPMAVECADALIAALNGDSPAPPTEINIDLLSALVSVCTGMGWDWLQEEDIDSIDYVKKAKEAVKKAIGHG